MTRLTVVLIIERSLTTLVNLTMSLLLILLFAVQGLTVQRLRESHSSLQVSLDGQPLPVSVRADRTAANAGKKEEKLRTTNHVNKDEPSFLNPEMIQASFEESPSGYLPICPSLCELADGSLLIVYHRTSSVDFKGEYSSWSRVSRDGGRTWGEIGDIAGGNHEFGASGTNSICFTSNGKVVIAYNWVRIPWDRHPGTQGGTRVAIIDKEWFY